MVCRLGITQPAVWMEWLSWVVASQRENSLSTASTLMSLIGGRRQAVAQLLAVRQRDLEQEAAGITVAKRCIVEHRMISGLQRAFCPARAGHDERNGHFEDPCSWLVASLGVRSLGIRSLGIRSLGIRSLGVRSLSVRFYDKGDVRVGPV